jgi:hypothetical protein
MKFKIHPFSILQEYSIRDFSLTNSLTKKYITSPPPKKKDEGKYKQTNLIITVTVLRISFLWERSTLRIKITFIYT